MNLFATSALLILFPLLFQLIYRSKALYKTTFIAFEYCTLISCFSQFIAIYRGLKMEPMIPEIKK